MRVGLMVTLIAVIAVWIPSGVWWFGLPPLAVIAVILLVSERRARRHG